MKTIYPKATHGIVNRAQNSIFSYQAWPSIARDENGTLYVVTSGFRVSHVCPFGKTVMYISKNEGNIHGHTVRMHIYRYVFCHKKTS